MPVLAGGEAGFADGPAALARFRFAYGLVVDAEGTTFIGDAGNLRVRKLSPDGEVSTVAGSGLFGCLDGPAAEARFKFPAGIGLDHRQPGTLLVADFMAHCVRAIDPSGTVTTVAGVPDESGHCDGPATQALFMNPSRATVGPAGDVFVADRGNHCIRRIDREGKTVTTVAGGRRAGLRDGVGPEAEFKLPTVIAIDVDGTLWVTDTGNHAIRRVQPDGTVTTVAGNGTAGYADGHGADAQFNNPLSLTLDHEGNLVVADTHNHCIRLLTPAGRVSTLLPPADTARRGEGAAWQGGVVCPCPSPCSVALTGFFELLVADFHEPRIHVIPVGLQPYQLDPIQRAMGRLFNNGAHADVVIVCGARQLWVHRAILASRSPYFAKLLKESPSDATPVRWVIPPEMFPEMRAFLRFVYSAQLQFPEDVFGLVDLCQRFEIPDGYRRGLRYCRHHASPATAVQWLVESHRRGLAELTAWLQPYVRERWDAIREVAPHSFNLLQPYPELLEATIPDRMRLRPRTLPAPGSSMAGEKTPLPT